MRKVSNGVDKSESTRKLASIVAVDMAGYSHKTEMDEAASLRAIAALRQRVTKAASDWGGRVFNTAGDGFMLEFPLVSSAVAAAEEIVKSSTDPVRVGVHLGEVWITEEGDLLGHGVNIAARIQQMASPGAVLVSGDVRRSIRGELGDRLKPQGSVRLEKMTETLAVFALAPSKGGKAKGRRRDRSALRLIAVGVPLLVLAGLGAWLLRDSMEWRSRGSTIAVVPFSAVGSRARDFAESLTETLQSAIDANNMQTVSSADASLLKGSDRDAVARRLGVRLLLDGTVDNDGPDTRVGLHLDDPRNHVTLWTTQKQGPSSQPSVLEARVGALAIAVMNCSTAALRPKGGLADAEALGLFLKACGVFEDQVGAGDNPETIYSFLDTLRQVVAKAPSFGPGHSALAKYLAYYRLLLPADQLAPLTAEASREAAKALATDPKDPEAYVALFLLRPQNDFLGREKLIDQALASDPSWLYAIIFKSVFLAQVGSMKEALAYAQKAVAANPLSTDITTDELLAWTGQGHAAEQELARIRTLWPGPSLWENRRIDNDAAGDWKQLDSTLDDSDRPANVTDADVAFFRTFYAAMRTRTSGAVARARAAILARAPDAYGGSSLRINMLARLGLVDDAFTMADGLAPGELETTPLLIANAKALQHDRRFMPLMAKLGLVDYWRSTGKWPDFCSDPKLPYDCKAEAASLVKRETAKA